MLADIVAHEAGRAIGKRSGGGAELFGRVGAHEGDAKTRHAAGDRPEFATLLTD